MLTPSDQASTVPAIPGVPARIPVRSSATVVILPTTSLGHASAGSGRPGASGSAHSRFQACASMSYSGST